MLDVLHATLVKEMGKYNCFLGEWAHGLGMMMDQWVTLYLV